MSSVQENNSLNCDLGSLYEESIMRQDCISNMLDGEIKRGLLKETTNS